MPDIVNRVVSGILHCVDTRSSRILANHAACNLLARNMLLLCLNSRLGSACFWPGQASRRQTLFTFFPQTYCGVVPWVKDYITPIASPPSRPMQSDNLYRTFLAGQQACPQRLSSLFLVHFERSSYPVSHWIYSYLSLRPSYILASKWAFLHNVAFSDPAGFHSLPLIRKQILCHLFYQSTGLGSMDYFVLAVLNRLQPQPCPPTCSGSGLWPPSPLWKTQIHLGFV